MWEDDEVWALDSYVNELNSLPRGVALPPTGVPGELALLAHRIRCLLTPQEPSPFFREALRARLIAAAQDVMLGPHPSWPSQHKRGLLIGAAVGSAISVLGLLAVLVRARRPARHIV